MKKTELVEMAIEAGLSKKAAADLVNKMFGKMTEQLATGGKVSISGFGTFSTTTRAARQGRNPLTGATININASTSAKFKQASQLKRTLNGK